MHEKRPTDRPRGSLILLRSHADAEPATAAPAQRPTLAVLLGEAEELRKEAARLATLPRIGLSRRERRELDARLHAVTEKIRANADAVRAARRKHEKDGEIAP